ncbi:hypothetical protein PAECIP111893_03881 [Paenibacillus plantiphilus]|uniref:Uncharacterized protein n=2 Tax=Paenibacillus plantiphilus TaxID=2905650 RepID=A0ABM9CKG6_9BACL|nr:hypothetical protein PAECIP111893_03881 [Paenibacillus plantiphilus]
MLAKGMDLESISEFTGISIEELKKVSSSSLMFNCQGFAPWQFFFMIVHVL